TDHGDPGRLGPLYMPSAGSEGAGRRWRGGRKGGTTLGTPFPSDPSLITVLTEPSQSNCLLIASGAESQGQWLVMEPPPIILHLNPIVNTSGSLIGNR
ncbi:hypothetical protein KUCAC02_021674, partial [Chaenocephalus aceratus]